MYVPAGSVATVVSTHRAPTHPAPTRKQYRLVTIKARAGDTSDHRVLAAPEIGSYDQVFVLADHAPLKSEAADAKTRVTMLLLQEIANEHDLGINIVSELLDDWNRQVAGVSGMTVLAGPVEATAIGNVVIQGRARGAVDSSLESIRHLIHRSFEPRVFYPTGTAA